MLGTAGWRQSFCCRWAGSALITATLLSACGDHQEAGSEYRSGSSPALAPSQRLLYLSEQYLALSGANDDFLTNAAGTVERVLPDRSYAGVKLAGQQAGLLLEELRDIARQPLSHEDALTAALLERDLKVLSEAPQHHWLFFDITPYNGGYVVSVELIRALKAIDLTVSGGVEHYLSLFTDVGRFLNELSNKLEAQRQRGILLPKASISRIRATYSSLRATLPDLTRFAPSRLEGVHPDQAQRLHRDTSRVLKEALYPAIDRLLGLLSDEYLAEAPEAAGLYQYPGGEAYYRYLIRRETSLNLTPDQIHEIGLRAVAGIQQEMQTVRQQLGFAGTAAEFHRELLTEKRLFAGSPEEVEQRYLAYVERIEPRLPEYFSQQPKTPYGVKRASPTVEQGMTHGYYRGGSAGETGYYYFNGSNLETRSLISAGFLIYHELIPGHHFHLSLVKENQQLSVYRRGISMNAFAEGWANYAAFLAKEMGMLDDPYDHYGWLLSNAYISVRLVLDTGLNHMGWSLEKASRYMLDNTIANEDEVAAEVLRYSTDIPAQALSYKLGYDKILELRRVAQAALGEKFDQRAFHSAVLSSGTLTLPVLEQHIDWFIDEELKRHER